MDFTGQFVGGLRIDMDSRRIELTVQCDRDDIGQEWDELRKCGKLVFSVKPWKKKRSLDANALLWHCLGKMAVALRADKWDIYLLMLKRYGKHTYIVVKENVVDAVKEQWRESEIIGEIDVNGQKGVQMLCYFGSSHYDTKEFSVLLDGVISEMKEMGLETPTSEEMRRSLELWEKHGN